MNRIGAFFCGIGVATVTFMMLSGLATPYLDNFQSWQARALEAEQQLDLMRARVHEAQQRQKLMKAQLSALQADLINPPETGKLIQSTFDTDIESFSVEYSTTYYPSDEFIELDVQGQEEWDNLVSETLHDEVQERFERTLTPEQEVRLLDTVSRFRSASVALDEPLPFTPDDTARLNNHLMRNIVLLEADRTFRQELGVGLAEFIQGFDSNQIKDVSVIDQSLSEER